MAECFSLVTGALAGADDLPLAYVRGALITRGQWRADVARAAATLFALPAGDVALYSTDCYQACVWLLGAWHAGRCVILPGDNTPQTTARVKALSVALVGEFADADITRWADAAPLTLTALAPELRAVEVFTSGSTGEPGRIPKKLAQLDDEMRAQEGVFGGQISRQACVVATVSQQHLYGLLFRIIWPLVAGRPFAAHLLTFAEELAQWPGNTPLVLVSSPAFLKRLPDQVDLSAFAARCQAVFSSGGPLPAAASHHLRERTGLATREIFGSSETGGIAWRNHPDHPWQALPGVDVAQTEDGLLQLRSAYLPDAAWYVTADRMRFDADGRFVLLGRADRIAKIEEKRISLTALETALFSTGLVSEARVIVLEGARVELGAALVLNDAGQRQLAQAGRKALIHALREHLAQGVERVGLPRRWRFVEALPQTSMGKTTELDVRMLFEKPRWPQVLATHTTEDATVLTLAITPDLAHFEGHFKEAAVLPGVAQLHWAVHFGRALFAMPPAFKGMDAIKFQHVILPGAEVTLTLRYRADKQQLAFSYSTGGRTHSSGRIVFGEAA
ncbi:ApeI family dehydratase [Silvimonas iriomotensis]|uniref:AMP-binding protein n=1 Tax=Silvimonas iriomotensis TaxID=449662 RepID=A0ABQ2P9K8_9NEIS|nr:AMP-binding protein [Silvimonas iriomotensis]GGP21752.1 AMP-binding protein [Silvimonas iriomotensis]